MKITAIKSRIKRFFDEKDIFFDKTKVGQGGLDEFGIHFLSINDNFLSYPIKDFFDSGYKNFYIQNYIKVNELAEWQGGRSSFEMELKNISPDGYKVYLHITISSLMGYWDFPFNLNSLADELMNLNQKINVFYDPTEDYNLGFSSELVISKTKITFGSIIQDFKEQIKNIINQASQNLLQTTKDNALTNIFNFPEEIRTSCEQYLIYFSQFLADLGVSATTSLKTQSGTTLFTIIPENPEQALSQIKKALDIYLKLPEMEDFNNVSITQTDISVQQLSAQIFHLKSQLMLAHSALQMKDATIKSLNFTNFQQEQLIETYKKQDENEEKLVGGLITVNHYETKGFKINLAELFRRLKRRLK